MKAPAPLAPLAFTSGRLVQRVSGSIPLARPGAVDAVSEGFVFVRDSRGAARILAQPHALYCKVIYAT
jgi:hypothetical protein